MSGRYIGVLDSETIKLVLEAVQGRKRGHQESRGGVTPFVLLVKRSQPQLPVLAIVSIVASSPNPECDIVRYRQALSDGMNREEFRAHGLTFCKGALPG